MLAYHVEMRMREALAASQAEARAQTRPSTTFGDSRATRNPDDESDRALGAGIRCPLVANADLVACSSYLKPSLASGDEPLRAGRPFERRRHLHVVKLNEVQDRRLEILEGIVDAATKTVAGQLPEEALDRVHPEAGGRRVVEGPVAMVLQLVRDGCESACKHVPAGGMTGVQG